MSKSTKRAPFYPKTNWQLTISTFIGDDPDAKHFYGRLRSGLRVEDVKHSSQLGTTIRFESKEAVVEGAMAWLRKRYPKGFELTVKAV